MTEIPYRKAVGEFNTTIDKQLEIFNLYGMGVYIPAIGIEITKAAMKLHKELSKVDNQTKQVVLMLTLQINCSILILDYINGG